VLIVARKGGLTNVARILIENGAHEPLLVLASKEGRTKEVQYLHRVGANIESFDHGNRDTPLTAACRMGQSDTVKVLLEKQANIEAIGIDRETPLISASK
jgi:ankyrin repeat protein